MAVLKYIAYKMRACRGYIAVAVFFLIVLAGVAIYRGDDALLGRALAGVFFLAYMLMFEAAFTSQLVKPPENPTWRDKFSLWLGKMIHKLRLILVIVAGPIVIYVAVRLFSVSV